MLGAARRLRAQARTRSGYSRWLEEGEPGGVVVELPGGVPPRALDGVQPAPFDETHVLIHGDDVEVEPHAKELFARALAVAPDAAVITCDEDRIGPRGRTDPVLRPGPSPERDLRIDPTGALYAVRRGLEANPLKAVAKHGRVHVTAILAHRRDEAPPTNGWTAVKPLKSEPSVEIIVPFKDRPDLLRRCLDSLRLTEWDRLTVTLVDNRSTDPDIPDVIAAHPGAELRRDDRPFNFSAINNDAARASSADVLVFLNNDTQITDPQWLEILVGYAMRPDVGCVAPLLLHPDGRVQHAGVAVGIHGTAGHPFAGLRPNTPTPFGAAGDGPRNWLAVTAGCMAIQRRRFLAADGFDEAFTIAGQDVDLGIRLSEDGLRSLCTPETWVIHDESASRAELGHLDADVALSKERYAPYLDHGDPYYHPALTRERTDCSFR